MSEPAIGKSHTILERLRYWEKHQGSPFIADAIEEIERLTAELGHAKAFGKATHDSLQLAREDYETLLAEVSDLRDFIESVGVAVLNPDAPSAECALDDVEAIYSENWDWHQVKLRTGTVSTRRDLATEIGDGLREIGKHTDRGPTEEADG